MQRAFLWLHLGSAFQSTDKLFFHCSWCHLAFDTETGMTAVLEMFFRNLAFVECLLTLLSLYLPLSSPCWRLRRQLFQFLKGVACLG